MVLFIGTSQSTIDPEMLRSGTVLPDKFQSATSLSLKYPGSLSDREYIAIDKRIVIFLWAQNRPKRHIP
jgi:hypothetical protein